MKVLHYSNVEDFCDTAILRYDDEFKRDNDNIVGIIAYYEDMKIILAKMVEVGYEIDMLDRLCDSTYDGYCDEYILTLWENSISVYRIYDEEKNIYYYTECTVLYVLGDVNSRALEKTDYTVGYEVDIDDEECEGLPHCDGDCACCDYYESEVEQNDSDDGMHVITISHSDEDGFSQVSVCADSKDLAYKYADKIVDLWTK